MKPKVYIETTIVSYLTSRNSRDIVITARKQETEDWWKYQRCHFECVVSEIVHRESSQGDSTAAALRVSAIDGMPIIELNEHVFELAKYLVQTQAVPEEYKEDAIHIALSAVHGIDYLLTWNFKHINNASKREAIEQALLDKGYHPPIICSPEELEGK